MGRIKDLEINLGWVNRLDLAEFPQLFFSVCQIISQTSTNIDDDRLIMAFDSLKREQINMETIRLYVRKQDLTKLLLIQDKRRKDDLLTILNSVKGRRRTSDISESEAARKVVDWIYEIAPDAPYYSRNRLTRYINIILGDSDNKTDIKEAIELLGIRRYFDDLTTSNSRFETLNIENDLLFSAKNLSATEKKEFRESAYVELKIFMYDLYSGMSKFGESQYKELYLALKKNLGDFHTALKMRRKKKSETNLNGETVVVNAKAKSILENTESNSDSNSAISSEISQQADIATNADNDVNSKVRA